MSKRDVESEIDIESGRDREVERFCKREREIECERERERERER